MKAVIFCGHHHTGKTTLIERAIGSLTRRGHKVGVVKHAAGPLDFRERGKDLSRYVSAGAVEVHLLSLPPGVSLQSDRCGGPGDPPLPEGRDETDGIASSRLAQRLGRLLADTSADFLLIEGFKDYLGPVPRIVFGRNREEIERLIGGNTVGYSGFGLGRARFFEARPERLRNEGLRPDPLFLSIDVEPDALADFLEEISSR